MFKSRRKKALERLYDRRLMLALFLRKRIEADEPHPYTEGMYEGINFAISLLEGRD